MSFQHFEYTRFTVNHVYSIVYVENSWLDHTLWMGFPRGPGDKHIYLLPFSSMRVNLAAQVLSHSVAAGISFLVTCKELPEEAIHTAHFVEHFDNLFNTFNSRYLK